MLRDEIKRKTTLGAQAKRHMDKGELIPDSLMIGVIEERLFTVVYTERNSVIRLISPPASLRHHRLDPLGTDRQ